MALSKKIAKVLVFWCVLTSFSVDSSVWMAVLVVAALDLRTLIPATPGNLGVYEAIVFTVCQFRGATAEAAMGIAVISHGISMVGGVGPGILLTVLPGFALCGQSALGNPSIQAAHGPLLEPASGGEFLSRDT
jgi:uncharacterized membrane protein YbhN (UPF0104 family)